MRTVVQGLAGSSWTLDVVEELTEEGLDEFTRLWFEVNMVEKDEQRPDSFSWKCSSLGADGL